MEMVLTLIVVPILAALLLLIFPQKKAQYTIAGAVLCILGVVSLSLFNAVDILTFRLSSSIDTAIVAADVALLLFFLYQGRVFNHPKVMLRSEEHTSELQSQR